MLRRIKRTRDYQVTLEIENDEFIAPPRESQRSWLVNRVLAELGDDLGRLDRLARAFVPGADPTPIVDRTQTELEDDEIMEDWQVPIMEAMARIVTESRGDVLEVGFGRGVSAEMIQTFGVRSHTVVECNDFVVARYHQWRQRHPDRAIRLLHGRWQDVVPMDPIYDGVFFHTYPLTEDEVVEEVVRSATFAAHFFATAAGVLRPGGVFTYLSNEIDTLSREHQRLLLEHFGRITISRLAPLHIPTEVRDAWWADSMVLVRAER